MPVAVLLLITWDVGPLTPAPGLDPSWRSGLHMAAEYGLGFGSQIDFTYGPLGFLSFPELWFADTGALAFGYEMIERLALMGALFYASRRDFGPVFGFLVAIPVGLLAGRVIPGIGDQAIPIIVLIVCARTLDADPSRRTSLELVGAAGALAAFASLTKMSIGIEVVALTVALLLGIRTAKARHWAVAAATFVLAGAGGWLLLGQPLDGLAPYVRNAAGLVSGFSSAMGLESAALAWEYAAAAGMFAFGVIAAFRMTRTSPVPVRRGILLLWTIFSFLSFKEGLVRHDEVHGAAFFGPMLGGLLAFRWPIGERRYGLAVVCAAATFTLIAQNAAIAIGVDPVRNVELAFTQAHQIVSRKDRHDVMDVGRASVMALDPLDPATLKLLQGHTVHVAPHETVVAWAYYLKWRPLPIFQSYTAYTTGLDRFNADYLASGQAPERILEKADAPVDGRVLAWDEPTTTRAILCRYDELRTTPVWQVLARGRNRCRTARRLGVVTAGWGETVRVPPLSSRHAMIYVRILGVAVSGLERIRSTLFKGYVRTVVIDGAPHRLVPGTAADGIVLRATSDVDFRSPFEVAPNPRTITVTRGGLGTTHSGELTYEFYLQPFTTGPRR